MPQAVSAGRAFIAGLAPALARQQALLTRLLDAVEADPRWDMLELGCSIPAGRGDALSDLDLLLSPGADSPTNAEVTALLRGLGEVVDVHDHAWGSVPRWWVRYADGTEIDLVVLPVERLGDRLPGGVALLDRHGALAATPPSTSGLRATPDELRDWHLDGWEQLANAAKYLCRGSPFEALERLHAARTRVLQLWAAGEGADHPAFGITSLLDTPGAALPPRLAETWCGAGLMEIRCAAAILAESLVAAARHASLAPTPLADLVTRKL